LSASDPDGLVRFFVVDERRDEDRPPSYNVAPTDPVPAVVEHDDRRYLVTFRWGLVPHWAGDRSGASRMINARSETAADKPAYRDALLRRRCLIPAGGFYEWQRGDGDTPLPYFIHPADQSVFAFAGLWETWRDPQAPDAAPLRTCTILTMPADARLAHLPARMPEEHGAAYRTHRWHSGRAPVADNQYGVLYPGPLTLFTGIHLAGPNLTVHSWQQGLFSYPPTGGGIVTPHWSFGNHGIWPFTDYTAFDDVTEIWWDPTASGPDETGTHGPGLYRYVEGGKRFLPGNLPTTDARPFDRSGTVTIYDSPPPGETGPDYPREGR
jgi:putative SOS response-associated peptidase YedK